MDVVDAGFRLAPHARQNRPPQHPRHLRRESYDVVSGVFGFPDIFAKKSPKFQSRDALYSAFTVSRSYSISGTSHRPSAKIFMGTLAPSSPLYTEMVSYKYPWIFR